jgi:methionyl-tRNA formyltransferase
MKFGFVTCVELGLSCMEAIYEVGGHLDLAITLPDDRATRKSGRVYLDDFCSRHNVPLIKSPNINDDIIIAAIKEFEIDWLFIIGWSQIALQDVLDAPLRGVLGMHPTLLPQGRGRAAIPWAIIKGLDKTGVTLFKLDGGIDTGDIIAQRVIPISPTTNASSLYSSVGIAHTELMRDVYPKLDKDGIQAFPQNHNLASEWPGRKPEDGRIDLTGSVHDAEKLVRAVTRPYPGAFFDTEDGKLIIWEAEMVSSTEERNSTDIYIDFYDGTLHCLSTETGLVAIGSNQ